MGNHCHIGEQERIAEYLTPERNHLQFLKTLLFYVSHMWHLRNCIFCQESVLFASPVSLY